MYPYSTCRGARSNIPSFSGYGLTASHKSGNHDGLSDQGTGFLSKKDSRPERVSSVMCGAAVYSVMLMAIACPENLHINDLVTASAFGAFIAIASAHASAVSISWPAGTTLLIS